MLQQRNDWTGQSASLEAKLANAYEDSSAADQAEHTAKM
jgi:hypothetical protein